MNNITQIIFKDLNINIEKLFSFFKTNITKLNFGRANPTLIKNLNINFKNNKYIPLYKLAEINVKDNNTIKLTVFDYKIIKNINSSILKSNLGITPIIKNNNIIYINIPKLTLESKEILKKFILQQQEKLKIAVRNYRRKANELLKINKNKKSINKDEENIYKSKIQKYIDNIILEIDIFTKQKLLRLMQ